MIKDADGHNVEFVQYMPGSLHSRNFGKLLPDSRISKRMIHVGVTIRDRAAADALYKAILAFSGRWYGAMKDDRAGWSNFRVPECASCLASRWCLHIPSR